LDWRETRKGWVCEIKEKTPFDPKSVRKLDLTRSVGALVGLRDGRAYYEVYAIRFDKSEYDREKAEKWVKEFLAVSPELVEKMAKKEAVPAQVLGVSTHEQKVLALLAHDALGKRKLARAEKMFHGLVTLNPTSNLGHTGMGKVYQAQGKTDEALRSFDEALKCFPSDVDAMLGKAELLIGKRQKKAALPLLLQIVYIDQRQIEPAGATARQLLADQYTNEELKDYVEFGKTKLSQQPAAGGARGPAARPAPALRGGMAAARPLNLGGSGTRRA
jgi:tetratricopeptide (TPR) repeat protein